MNNKELRPCPFCGGTAITIQCGLTKDWLATCLKDGCFGVNDFQDEQGGASNSQNKEADAVSAWNARYEPNPWKYPSRGELPMKSGSYLITYEVDGERFVDIRRWDGYHWMGRVPVAWRELDEPAPVLEEEQPEDGVLLDESGMVIAVR